MPYPAIDVAKTFIQLAYNDGKQITHLKVQKLLYFLQGWTFAFYDRPFINEDFEAWGYGPVVPEVYRVFKAFGSSPLNPEEGEDYLSRITGDDSTLLKEIWKVYGQFSAFKLSEMTHVSTSPWQGRYTRIWGIHDSGTIDRETLSSYFKQLKLASAKA